MENSETYTQATPDCWLSEPEVSEFYSEVFWPPQVALKMLPKHRKSEENPRSPYCLNRTDASACLLASLARAWLSFFGN